MEPAELLERLALTLRNDIGPAVDGDYQRTQAFMGAVVVEKIARQLRAADAQADADEREITALFAELDVMLGGEHAAVALQATLTAARSRGAAGLCDVIAALYQSRAALGEATFDATLRAIRTVLRAQIDRRVEVAR